MMKNNWKDIKVCLDSRLIKKGDYFVPIKGENFNGYDYIESALKNGAKGIIEESDLYDIAVKKLKEIKPIVIAITGSVGKTSTSRYIYKLLKNKYNAYLGYLNTKLGLAVNILNDLKTDADFFIAECGMDRKGELFETGTFIQPDSVVLTNISESHAEKLGTLEDIKEAKSELIKTLDPKKGVLFFNSSFKDVVSVADSFKTIKKIPYGIPSKNSIVYKGTPNLIGIHQKTNANAAVVVSKYYGCSVTKKSLMSLKPEKGRFNILKGMGGSTLIDDTYNASRVSTLASLKAYKNYVEGKDFSRRFIVLGHMAELGIYEKQSHISVGDFIGKYSAFFDLVILVGSKSLLYSKSSFFIQKKIPYKYFETHKEVLDYINNQIKPTNKDIFLFKGSQSARLELVLKNLLYNPKIAKKVLVRQDARWV